MASFFVSPVRRFFGLELYYQALSTTGGFRAFETDGDSVRSSKGLINSSAQFLGGVTSALNTFFERVERLQNAASVLVVANGKGVFAQKEGVSSDPDLFDIKVGNGANDVSFRIAASRRAQAQQNASDALVGYDETTVYPGGNYIKVTDSKTSKTIAFEISRFFGNRSSLFEMRDQINNANVGIRAEVRIDGKYVRLVLTTATTGSKGSFTVTDSAGNGVRATEVDTVVLAAQDARVAVDGAGQDVASNKLELQGGAVKIEVLRATSKVVSILVRGNQGAIVKAAEDFAQEFNDVLAFLANGTFAQATRAKDALSGPIRQRREQLEAIGIVQDASGRLVIERDQFKAALDSDAENVKDLLGGPKGIATRLAGDLARITQGPLARPLSLSLGASISGLFAAPGFGVDATA